MVEDSNYDKDKEILELKNIIDDMEQRIQLHLKDLNCHYQILIRKVGIIRILY